MPDDTDESPSKTVTITSFGSGGSGVARSGLIAGPSSAGRLGAGGSPGTFPGQRPGTVGIVTTESRASMLMLLAAKYIRRYAPDKTVHYDEADCDGACLADDLEIEARSGGG